MYDNLIASWYNYGNHLASEYNGKVIPNFVLVQCMNLIILLHCSFVRSLKLLLKDFIQITVDGKQPNY